MNTKKQRSLLLALLFLFIIIGNCSALRIFETADIIFGNIPVYIIALLFHPFWAGAAGLLSALIVSFNYGHFYLVPVFFLEALLLSLSVRRRKPVVPIIMLAVYWILIGLPLTAFLITEFLDLPKALILIRLEIYLLNSLFSISVTVLILSKNRIQKQPMVSRLHLNNFFSIVSSYLYILVMVIISIVLSVGSRHSIDHEINYEAELLRKSSDDLVLEIDKIVSESPWDAVELSSLIRQGTDQEILKEFLFILEHRRINAGHYIALKDSTGRVLAAVPDSFSFVADLSENRESVEGSISSYDKDILLWMPLQKNYRTMGILESRLVSMRKIETTGWTIQAEMTQHEIIAGELETIGLILLLLTLITLFFIPVLKIMSYRFGRVLDSLILLSSRNMYGLETQDDDEEDWPESSIAELRHLSYRLKEIISHQKKANCLLNRQNAAFSEMNTALMRSEENLRITLNSIADGVIVSDAEGRLLSINPVASRLCGYTEAEDNQPYLSEILSLEDEFTGEVYSDYLDAVLKRGEVLDSAVRYHIQESSGQVSIVTLGAAPIRMTRNAEIRGAVIVLRDISESRELEDQLRQAQKMEIVGQLAGGIAHDFNNLLGGIQGMIAVMKLDLEEYSGPWSKLDDITRLIKRASDLTSKLLSFSRKGRMVSRVFDFHHIIEETRSLLNHSLPGEISILCQLNAQESRIQGDPTEIQRVLMNLALNARDAITGEGQIIITTDTLSQGTQIKTLTGNVILDKSFFYLSVSDTGCGIPSDIKKHIFEPFFSTKHTGNSSGLGLSAVYGSLLEHHGYIDLQSKEGEGTVFSLFYPLAVE